MGSFLFGDRLLQNGAVFVPLVIAGLICTIVQTFLIYRYFSPPKQPPRHKFLRHPESETLADTCIFLNMILFQVVWNMLTFADLGRPSGPLEFFGRLFLSELHCAADLFSAADVLSGRRHQPPAHVADDATCEFTGNHKDSNRNDRGVALKRKTSAARAHTHNPERPTSYCLVTRVDGFMPRCANSVAVGGQLGTQVPLALTE